MPKKKKAESLSDILDRIDEDLMSVREKIEELEDHECDSDDEDLDDEDLDSDDDDSEE